MSISANSGVHSPIHSPTSARHVSSFVAKKSCWHSHSHTLFTGASWPFTLALWPFSGHGRQRASLQALLSVGSEC